MWRIKPVIPDGKIFSVHSSVGYINFQKLIIPSIESHKSLKLKQVKNDGAKESLKRA